MAGIVDPKQPTAANMEERIMLVSEYLELYNTAMPSHKDNQNQRGKGQHFNQTADDK